MKVGRRMSLEEGKEEEEERQQRRKGKGKDISGEKMKKKG